MKDDNPVQYKVLLDKYKEELAEYKNQHVQEQLNNAESFLTMSENNLIKAAKAAGLDPTRPAKELQEELYTTAVSDATAKLPAQNMGYTNAEIAFMKKQYLERLKNNPFIGLTANAMGISERLVQSWIRTDQDFAAIVYDNQKRMAENLAARLITTAMGEENDTSVQMFLAKQYGSVFKDALVQTFAGVNAVQDVPDSEGMPLIENLTPEEQLALLTLMRKARDPESVNLLTSYTPTKFIEDEIEDGEFEDIESDENN